MIWHRNSLSIRLGEPYPSSAAQSALSIVRRQQHLACLDNVRRCNFNIHALYLRLRGEVVHHQQSFVIPCTILWIVRKVCHVSSVSLNALTCNTCNLLLTRATVAHQVHDRLCLRFCADVRVDSICLNWLSSSSLSLQTSYLSRGSPEAASRYCHLLRGWSRRAEARRK